MWCMNASTVDAGDQRATTAEGGVIRRGSAKTDRHQPSRDAIYETVSMSISSGVGSGRGTAAGVREDKVGEGESAEAGRMRPTTVLS